VPGTYGATSGDQVLWPGQQSSGQQGGADQQHRFGSHGHAQPASGPPAAASPASSPPAASHPASHPAAAHPYGAPQHGRAGGTVYGSDPGPSSAPPVDSGNPYGAGTPGLRNVGGPANNQQYYPNQQQPPAYPPPNPVETSGSLTGHILGQGRADTPPPGNRTAKVVIILAVVLVVMVGLGLLAATLFGDMISDLLGGLGG
jgi:hypothetical protein